MPNPWSDDSSTLDSINTRTAFQEETASSTKTAQSAAEATVSTSSSSISRQIQRSTVFPPDLQALMTRHKISVSMALHLFELRKVEIVLKLLVFIASDGAPTDDEGRPTIHQLEDLLRNRRNAERTYVEFLLCTDDPTSINYLTGWDRTMENLDIVRVFEQEHDEILRIGRVNHFTFGDYIVKALVGAMVPDVDSLDEPRS